MKLIFDFNKTSMYASLNKALFLLPLYCAANVCISLYSSSHYITWNNECYSRADRIPLWTEQETYTYVSLSEASVCGGRGDGLFRIPKASDVPWTYWSCCCNFLV